jgi:molybdopterin synthase catalytic subunit
MRLEVRTFGGLAERAGLTALTIELPDEADVAQLRRAIASTHPELAPLMDRVAVVVDLEVARDDLMLAPGQEIALLPPVAGGAGDHSSDPAPSVEGRTARMDVMGSSASPTAVGLTTVTVAPGRVHVTGLVQGAIDIPGVIEAIGAPDVGAVVSFLGTVRDHAPDLDDVVRLDYSAYDAMAARELERIAVELRTTHPDVRGLALVHAVGELPVGAHTILVAASSPHRDVAFDACRAALEAVKSRVPVFKREVTAEGAHRWVGLEPG